VNIQNTGNNTDGGFLQFKLDKGAVGADGDRVGRINWRSDNDEQEQTDFGTIYTKVSDATNGEEAGDMYLLVASYDGTLRSGLYLDGDTNAIGEVDVIIATGSASTTTIAGTLNMGATPALTNAGLVVVANQSNITGLGTISSGVWNGDDIPVANGGTGASNLDAFGLLGGTQTFTGGKTFSAPIISDGNRTLAPGGGAAIHVDAFDVTDGATSASGTTSAFNHVVIEAPRLIAAEESVTTTNASTLYIKGPPVQHTNQTITNAYSLLVDSGDVRIDNDLIVNGTITGNVTGDLTGEADTVASIAGLAPNTATTQATQAAITTCSNLITVGTITSGDWEGSAIETDQQNHLMHYQFLGYTTGDGDHYEMPQNLTDGQAPFEHADTSSADGLTIPGTGGNNQRDLIRMGGHLMVNTSTLKKWTGVATNNNNKDLTLGLFKWTPTDNSSGDMTPVLLEEVVIAGKGTNLTRTFSTASFDSTVAAGDIIFTQMKTEASGNIGFFNSTLEVEF